MTRSPYPPQHPPQPYTPPRRQRPRVVWFFIGGGLMLLALVVFVDTGFSADCTATDSAGDQVDFRPVTGDFTYNQWTAVSRFDTGDGNLTFDCVETSPDSMIRIASLPSTGGFVGGLLVGILVAGVLGLTGLAMLIVTGVLWATGTSRRPAA